MQALKIVEFLINTKNVPGRCKKSHRKTIILLVFEYVLDFSPDSDAEFYYANNTNTRYSLNFDSDEETEHNIRVGYGFDVSSKTGWSLISNFERFYVLTSLVNSSYNKRS